MQPLEVVCFQLPLGGLGETSWDTLTLAGDKIVCILLGEILLVVIRHFDTVLNRHRITVVVICLDHAPHTFLPLKFYHQVKVGGSELAGEANMFIIPPIKTTSHDGLYSKAEVI